MLGDERSGWWKQVGLRVEEMIRAGMLVHVALLIPKRHSRYWKCWWMMPLASYLYPLEFISYSIKPLLPKVALLSQETTHTQRMRDVHTTPPSSLHAGETCQGSPHH